MQYIKGNNPHTFTGYHLKMIHPMGSLSDGLGKLRFQQIQVCTAFPSVTAFLALNPNPLFLKLNLLLTMS
jgi:hypothetical protein